LAARLTQTDSHSQYNLPVAREPLPIFCPISHILTREIRDDAILADGYTSAEPFNQPTRPGNEGHEGAVETGVTHAAGLSKTRPACRLLGEFEDGTDALLGVRLLCQPAWEEHWL
jgi:hypothetical protein